jgi:hypothetical protein
VDVEETLRQWEGKIFKTATELCEQHLVPEGHSLESMAAFWAAHQLTGDNTKERPYANLYGLATTQSNSYTMHIIAETILKSPGTPVNRFVSGVDQAGSRYRGKVGLTRRFDTQALDLPDYISDPYQDGLETRYFLAADQMPSEPQFQILSIRSLSAHVVLRWSSSPGRRYQVEVSSDLKEWSAEGESVFANGEMTEAEVKIFSAYRVRRLF